MKKILFVLLLSALLISGCALLQETKTLPLYQQNSVGIEQRVDDLLARMTLEEKIDLLGGAGFETKAIKRLGIPALKMTDGPVGVRWGKSTAFPAGIAMGATWDPELVARLGGALAEETKAKGRHVILGPCVNIARLPMAGRNFESFGEDPYLTSRLAVGYIQGVQREHVVATVKHFAANNQEHQRDVVDTLVDERALQEIYLPAFKSAVEEAKVLAVMSAYNKLNGYYCSENQYLLQKKLRDEWKFTGVVMSDWGGVHNAIPTFNSGLDLEMPSATYLTREELLAALRSEAIQQSVLDEKVRRILRVMFTIGLFDEYEHDFTTINNDEHIMIAADVARAGIVLLKNEHGILPLDRQKIQSMAIIGSHSAVAQTGGGGSSKVSPFHAVSPLEAMRNKIGDKIKIHFAQGYQLSGDINAIEARHLFVDSQGKTTGLVAEYFANKELAGPPAKKMIDKQVNFSWGEGPPLSDFPADDFSVRWTGYLKVDEPGRYLLDVAGDDGVRLTIEDTLVIDDWSDHDLSTKTFAAEFAGDRFYKITLEYYENRGSAGVKLGWRRPQDNLQEEAVAAAQKSDVALVFVGTSPSYESEGFDRDDLALPKDQDALIQKVAAANKNTVVVLATGSPVLMDQWIDSVSGVLETWFAGEQAGTAIAEILLGEANPSGKLPMTFPKRWQDCSAFASYKHEDGRSVYSEGIYVGYRHFEKKRITPLFPFGFGLSYSTFQYRQLQLSANELPRTGRLAIRFEVENTGLVKGAEIAQLYVKNLSTAIDHPEKELKGFAKILLNPGEKKIVLLEIDETAVRFFDPVRNAWRTEAGEYEVLVGSSSEDIRLKEKFRVTTQDSGVTAQEAQ